MNSLLYSLIIMGIFAVFFGIIKKEFGKPIAEGWNSIMGKKKIEPPKPLDKVDVVHNQFIQSHNALCKDKHNCKEEAMNETVKMMKELKKE